MPAQRKVTRFFTTQPRIATGESTSERDIRESSERSPVSQEQSDNPAESASEVEPSPKRSRTVFHPLDIGNYVRRESRQNSILTDEEKYEVLVNVWKPGVTYSFPKVLENGRSRSFQHRYLEQWPWLAYSETYGAGAFCKHCILFAKEDSSSRGGTRLLGILVMQPLVKFKKAIEVFKNHELCGYHREASEDARTFLSWHEDKTSRDVRNRLSTAREQQVLRNRQRLMPIIRTVLLCGRQNIPLRGHRDHGELLTDDDSINDGNFRALLRFRVDAGDEQLEEHLINASKNATYVSSVFQNEVIEAIGKIIRRKIVDGIKTSRYFTLLADETRDVARSDQLSICLRYVALGSGRYSIREVFLKFCEIGDRSGAGLARCLFENLQLEGLDIRDIRGQGYDGCSAMSGCYKGVQAEVKAMVPQALYFHCASHCLNLALVHPSEIATISLAAAIVGKVCNFFCSSSVRLQKLGEKIETLSRDSHKR